jgi:hypothetical protein
MSGKNFVACLRISIRTAEPRKIEIESESAPNSDTKAPNTRNRVRISLKFGQQSLEKLKSSPNQPPIRTA